VRSFRFQWPADLLTSWAFEMETLILGWYVMVDTGSVLLLTTFGSLQQLGTLAAPMFGVLGDRLGGRTMLCVMRASYALLAASLMILSFADMLSPAYVLVVAALGGHRAPERPGDAQCPDRRHHPARSPDGAVGMSRTTMDSARVAGALAGATLSATLGIGRAYCLRHDLLPGEPRLTFGVSKGRPVPDPSAGPLPSRRAAMSLPRPSSWREMLDGLLYVWARPTMLATMWLAFLVNLTAYPASGGLLPYVARNIYGADANGLGWLVAGFSFGALLGSIGMVVTGGPRHPERSMVVYTAIWYALLLAFGYVTTMTAGIAVLIVTGIAQSIAMISMAASLLRAADDRFRGRVMGVRMLAVYGMPLGLMAAGALVERIGFPGTITVYSVIGLALTGLIGAKWRASVWAHEASMPLAR
jgi:MFS family permease